MNASSTRVCRNSPGRLIRSACCRSRRAKAKRRSRNRGACVINERCAPCGYPVRCRYRVVRRDRAGRLKIARSSSSRASERRQARQRCVGDLRAVAAAVVVRVSICDAFGNRRVSGIPACVSVVVPVVVVSQPGQGAVVCHATGGEIEQGRSVQCRERAARLYLHKITDRGARVEESGSPEVGFKRIDVVRVKRALVRSNQPRRGARLVCSCLRSSHPMWVGYVGGVGEQGVVERLVVLRRNRTHHLGYPCECNARRGYDCEHARHQGGGHCRSLQDAAGLDCPNPPLPVLAVANGVGDRVSHGERQWERHVPRHRGEGDVPGSSGQRRGFYTVGVLHVRPFVMVLPDDYALGCVAVQGVSKITML